MTAGGPVGSKTTLNNLAKALSQAAGKAAFNRSSITALKAALRQYDADKSFKAPPPESDPPPPDAQESDDKGEHTDEQLPNSAILGGAAYAVAGARYIEATASRNARYKDYAHLTRHGPDAMRTVESVAKFPGGPVVNFNEKVEVRGRPVGKAHPYSYQAHHLLPRAVFDNHVPSDLKRVLQKSDYDINHGSNIIMLPDDAKHMIVHALPCHYSSHPNYSKFVGAQLDNLNKKLREIVKKKKKHKDTPAKVKSFLLGVHDDCWDLICSIGQEIAGGVGGAASDAGLVTPEGRLA